MSITLCRDWTDFWAANIAVWTGDECRCNRQDRWHVLNILLPLAVQRKHGFTMENVNASLPAPQAPWESNQACQNKEMAREFILSLCWDATSSQRTFQTAFRSIPLAVRDWVDREDNKDTSVAVSGDDGYELNGSWPTKEERRMVFDVAAKADHPIRMDRVLTDIIINETKGYFEGDCPWNRRLRMRRTRQCCIFRSRKAIKRIFREPVRHQSAAYEAMAVPGSKSGGQPYLCSYPL